MSTSADALLRDAARPDTAKPLSRRRKALLWASMILALLVGGSLFVRGMVDPRRPAEPVAGVTPPKVTVSSPVIRRMATWSTFTGQFSAVDRVEIRAQVSGYLTEIHFKDGQQVNKGDLLFVIDPRPYEIALANAKAQVETAQASLQLSKKQLERTTNLMRSDFASRETMDQRTQAQQAATATLDQARAALRSAELNLGWTRIVAPISGKISAHRVSIGNLVAGGQGAGGATTMLTTVVSLDPIYLDFDMGEGDYVAYQRYLHRARGDKNIDHGVEIALTDEIGWKHKGKLDFLDNEVDRSSGTLHARVTVPNADLFIAAGQFGRLRVPTSDEVETLLLPEAALSTDQDRTLVMTVGDDGTVVPKTVKTGAAVGDLRVVKSGVTPNDRVVINGLMFARPGGKVTPDRRAFAVPPDEG